MSMAMMWLATESSIPSLPMLYVMRSTFTLGSFSSLSTGSVSSHHLFSCSVYSPNLLPNLLWQCLFTEPHPAVSIHRTSSSSVYSLNLLWQCLFTEPPLHGNVYSPNLIRKSLFTYTKPPLAVSILRQERGMLHEVLFATGKTQPVMLLDS